MGRKLVGNRFVALLTVVILGVVALSSARADFEAGLQAYDAGDYATAIAEWQPLADQGNLEAQFGMGIIYENGRGIGRDNTQAAEWYTLAAEGGHPGAQFNLGNMYQQGLGVSKDPTQAVYWWTLAAAQGLADAQLNLGIAYHRGDGVAVDQVVALSWFERAAEAGNAMGQFSAGYAYETGLGVEPDLAVARRYYAAAAASGVEQAAVRLAALGPADEEVEVATETVETEVETVETEPVTVEETVVEDMTVEEVVEDDTVVETAGSDEQVASVDESVVVETTEDEGSAVQQVGVATGPYIQLAAYLSEDRAEEAWRNMNGQYPDLLDGLPHRVLRVDLGGELGIVYRLQAGPMPATGEAQSVCSQLKQRNADCFLVDP